MPRYRGYNLDELRAAWESGNFSTAPEVMEFLGIPDEHRRGVQATIRKFYGRRPKAAGASLRTDLLKRAVLKYLVDVCGLRRDYCSICQTYCGSDVYLRQLGRDDELGSVVIVGKCCKRAGDV